MSAMKILVVDGMCFIGLAVIRRLISGTNHSVFNVDRLTYAMLGNLERLASDSDSNLYAFEQVDIWKANEIKRVFERVVSACCYALGR